MEPIPQDNNGDRTYENLSKEFRQEYPRVLKLIPMMYDRLTLVDKLSHADALNKICNDHKDLPGFSRRNIHRHLPSDNPNVPHRVVPTWHKSSDTELNQPTKLSTANSSYRVDEPEEVMPATNGTPASTECPYCKIKLAKIEELRESLKGLGTNETFSVKDGPREFELTIPFRELKLYLIRQKNRCGQEEPVLIYARTDSTCSKVVSFSLGKKPYS
jgi:hypothetical protein